MSRTHSEEMEPSQSNNCDIVGKHYLCLASRQSCHGIFFVFNLAINSPDFSEHPATLQNLGMEQKMQLFPQEHYLTTKAAQ